MSVSGTIVFAWLAFSTTTGIVICRIICAVLQGLFRSDTFVLLIAFILILMHSIEITMIKKVMRIGSEFNAKRIKRSNHGRTILYHLYLCQMFFVLAVWTLKASYVLCHQSWLVHEYRFVVLTRTLLFLFTTGLALLIYSIVPASGWNSNLDLLLDAWSDKWSAWNHIFGALDLITSVLITLYFLPGRKRSILAHWKLLSLGAIAIAAGITRYVFFLLENKKQPILYWEIVEILSLALTQCASCSPPSDATVPDDIEEEVHHLRRQRSMASRLQNMESRAESRLEHDNGDVYYAEDKEEFGGSGANLKRNNSYARRHACSPLEMPLRVSADVVNRLRADAGSTEPKVDFERFPARIHVQQTIDHTVRDRHSKEGPDYSTEVKVLPTPVAEPGRWSPHTSPRPRASTLPIQLRKGGNLG